MKINLVEGNFTDQNGNSGITATAQFSSYIPVAKIGNNNYVYVYGGGTTCCPYAQTGINYFGLSIPTSTMAGGVAWMSSSPGLTVQQAYAIDSKMDDGLPQKGNVVAQYVNGVNTGQKWAAGGGAFGASDTSATPGSSTTCYDNNSVASGTQTYSVKQNNGTGVNCAMSFQFQ